MTEHEELFESRQANTPAIGRLQQRPLVGREQEYAFLYHHLLATELCGWYGQTEQAAPRDDGLARSWSLPSRSPGVLLLGEAGIGKTRLAEEVSREAFARGWAVVWSRCYLQESHIPYRLWSEILRHSLLQDLWPSLADDDEPTILYQPLIALHPELASLLPLRASVAPLSYEQERMQLWDAMLALLTNISKCAPVLVVLDDLQWADTSSVELFGYLARRLTGLPVLLVSTCRDTDMLAKHPLRTHLASWLREQAATTLHLAALSDEHIRTLLADVPEPLAEHIQKQVAGNPLFAEELARAFSVEGTQQPRATLPQTIATVLDQRLARLSPPCQTLLSHAAVLGESLSFSVLLLMENTGRDKLDEEPLLALLEEALQAAILMEEHEGNQVIYHFWHPLLMERLYTGLSATRRARLHQRAANVLRGVYVGREEEGAALMCNHLILAGADALDIVDYARLAGDRAYALLAYSEAERHYRIVLEQGETHFGATSRLRAADQEKLLCLFERLGECTRIQGKFEEARRFYEQALEIQQRQSHAASFSVQALFWVEIGVTWYSVGNIAQARQCYAYGEQVLRDADISAGPAWAYLRFQHGYASWREGNYGDAERCACEALALFQQAHAHPEQLQNAPAEVTRSRRILAGDPINLGRAQVLQGIIDNCTGHSSEALKHLHAALELYEQHNYRREIAIVCCNLGDAYMRKAQHEQAQSFFQRSLLMANSMGEIPSAALAAGNLGILALHRGHLAQAEAWLKRSVAQTETFDDPGYSSMMRTYLAIVLQEQGRLAESRVMLHLALSIARAAHIMPYKCLALVTLGSLRFSQAIAAQAGIGELPDAESQRMLQQARRTLQRALLLEDVEIEMRLEGQLMLAQVLLLLNEGTTARLLLEQTLAEVERCALIWLSARALRLLASAYALEGQHQQADNYFEQAILAACEHDMRLEQARALQHYGLLLLRRADNLQDSKLRGQNFLHEALEGFIACQATLDVHIAEQLLHISTGAEPQSIVS